MRHREPADAIAGAIGGALFGLAVWLALASQLVIIFGVSERRRRTR
jgi:hypothetical protein